MPIYRNYLTPSSKTCAWRNWGFEVGVGPCSCGKLKRKGFPMRKSTWRAYHGSPFCIERFDYAFTEHGDDIFGSGFYFATHLDEALKYASDKSSLSTDQLRINPTIHIADITMKTLCLQTTKAKSPRPRCAKSSDLLLRNPVKRGCGSGVIWAVTRKLQ